LSSVQAQSPDYTRHPATSPCDFVDYPGPTSATQLGCDTFTAADFNFSGHILSLDYTNGPTHSTIVPNTTPSAGQILVGNAGGTAYAPQTMSGDATLASTGALTIAADAVTNAKLADMAAHTLKANITGSSANPVDSSLSAILDAELGSTNGYVATRVSGTWTAGISSGVGGRVKLAQVVTSGSQSVITFSSIPGTYTDLVITFVGQATGAGGSTTTYIKFNSTAGTAAPTQILISLAPTNVVGSSQGADATRGSFVWETYGTAFNASPGTSAKINIPGYSSSLKKFFNGMYSVNSTNSGTAGNKIVSVGGAWATAAAVTQIDITISSGSFLNGSICTLYADG
jgi:hypothetical protein